MKANSALFRAATRKRVKPAAVRAALDAGGDPDALHRHDGWIWDEVTPLMAYLERRPVEVALVRAFVGDPNRRTPRYGLSALVFAARWGHTEAIDALIELGADPDLISTERDHGTALCAAINHPEAVEALLRGGATVDLAAPEQSPPLLRAIERNARAAFDLLRPRADLARTWKTGIRGGAAALAHAIEWWPEVVPELLAAGAPADPPEGHAGVSPVCNAMLEDAPAILQALLDAGACIDRRDDEGKGPIHWALRFLKTEARAAMLLERGADPNLRGPGGRTPLHRAVEEADLPAARLLLEHGADPGLRSPELGTPAELAAAQGRPILAALLGGGGEAPEPLDLAIAGLRAGLVLGLPGGETLTKGYEEGFAQGHPSFDHWQGTRERSEAWARERLAWALCTGGAPAAAVRRLVEEANAPLDGPPPEDLVATLDPALAARVRRRLTRRHALQALAAWLRSGGILERGNKEYFYRWRFAEGRFVLEDGDPLMSGDGIVARHSYTEAEFHRRWTLKVSRGVVLGHSDALDHLARALSGLDAATLRTFAGF